MSTLHKVRRVIVLRNGVTPVAATTRLYNLSTDAINVPVGNAAAFQPEANSGNPSVRTATANLTVGQYLEFIFRNDTSTLRNPLQLRTLEHTGKINPMSSCGVRINRQLAVLGQNEMHVLDASFNASSVNGAFAPQENFYYLITTRAKGAMMDMYTGTAGSSSGKTVDYTSPDFTSLGITNIQAQRDLILANLCRKHNLMNNPAARVHVAINLSQTNPGHTGAQTINDIITAGVGARILIGFMPNGEADYLVISQDILNTLQALVAAGTTLSTDAGTSGIENFYVIPYLLNDTPYPATPATLHIAGTGGATIRAQHMLFICLDFTKPIYEERVDFKTGLELGLTSGFTEFGANQVKLSYPVERIGYSNRVRLDYREEDYRRYNEKAGRPYESFSNVRYTDEIREGGYYDAYEIEWCTDNSSNDGALHRHHRMLTIYVPNYTLGGSTAVNANYTGVANAFLAYLNTLLNNFSTINLLGDPGL